jgi:L-ribulose-5-phosphate 4-epimerase
MAQPYDPGVVQGLKEKLAQSCRILYHLGLADYLGHPSVRIPGTSFAVIKPRFSVDIRSMSEMTARHMIVVDVDGNRVEGDHFPPTETAIHTEIYRARPDVFSIVHTHQTMSTAFGMVDRPLLPLLHEESEVVSEEIPVYPHGWLINSRELGEEMVQALGGHRILHLQNHGVVVTGPDVEHATIDTIRLERLANMNYITAVLGNPRAMTQADMDRVMEQKQGIGARWAYYTGLVDPKA